MAVLKCKMCGGDLNFEEGVTVVECAYCGIKQTVPNADNEKKLTLFGRANRLRYACEFDKASGVYESIVADFPEEAEAYWGLVLCKYGIEYVDDPATGRKVPTCHRSSFESVMEDDNFEQAQENADPLARSVYREEAKRIEELRRGIIEVSGREEPYDIFLCYKETDEDGNRTLDSVLAQDVYDALTAKGYRVFFSRITLEDKLGQEYEPYIFAALNSARIMLAFGTDYEYYNAVWVKNEWSRFLQLIAKGEKKTLIPCYKNIDAYDIPKEFAKLQAQDMGKVGALQDLLRGIEKILPKNESASVTETVVVPQTGQSATAASLLERAFMYLEDSDWENAEDYCNHVLDISPKETDAYIGLLLAELHLRTEPELASQTERFDQNKHFQKALRFATEERKSVLEGYKEAVENYLAEQERKRIAEERRKEAQEQLPPDTSTQVGDIVQYGDYHQKPIQWLVLDKQDGKLLLLSREILEERSYNNIGRKITWKKSTIRKWLNEKFYYTAFSQTEQGCILTAGVKNENNPEYETKGGDDTVDKIFLISIREAEHYLLSSSACSARLYGNPTWWWLRSPGDRGLYAANVSADGDINVNGNLVSREGGGVRPAFWFNLKA